MKLNTILLIIIIVILGIISFFEIQKNKTDIYQLQQQIISIQQKFDGLQISGLQEKNKIIEDQISQINENFDLLPKRLTGFKEKDTELQKEISKINEQINPKIKIQVRRVMNGKEDQLNTYCNPTGDYCWHTEKGLDEKFGQILEIPVVEETAPPVEVAPAVN